MKKRESKKRKLKKSKPTCRKRNKTIIRKLKEINKKKLNQRLKFKIKLLFQLIASNFLTAAVSAKQETASSVSARLKLAKSKFKNHNVFNPDRMYQNSVKFGTMAATTASSKMV